MTARSRSQVADFFDRRAEEYDAAFEARSIDGHSLRARMQTVLRLLGEGPGDALDAGMGPGRLCSELERRGWTISGVDASPEMVALARRRLPGADDRLHVGAIEELPFPNGSFDVVVATGVLEYVDARAALSELARVLRPSGRAIVSYPNPDAFYRYSKTAFFYPIVRAWKRIFRRSAAMGVRGATPIKPREFEHAIEAAGLELAASQWTSYLPIPAPFDQLFPSTANWLGQRVEGRGGRFGRLLAGQIVYLARRPA